VSRAAPLLATGLCSAAALCATPAPVEAQDQQPFPLPQVYRDHETGLLVYFAELPGRAAGEVRLGYVSDQIYWFFNPLSPLQPGFGCRFIQPEFTNVGFCDGPVNGFLVRLGPGPNDVHVLPTVPRLTGPNEIRGNRNKDKLKGGQNDEKIKGGKGNDVINPGPGQDAVDAGPGNDEANTADGEVDRLNGGKGKDGATVDKVDKVKNVEKVKRK
jgi:hypothetical protein